MNNVPITMFKIAIKISSGPWAELSVIPRGPVKLNSSINPMIHNSIPTTYIAMKLLVKYIATAKRIKITPISGSENKRLKIPHTATIILVLFIHFCLSSTDFTVRLLFLLLSFKTIPP